MYKFLEKRLRMNKLEVNLNFLLKIIDCIGCELLSSIGLCRILVY